jgi:hypothetical protein
MTTDTFTTEQQFEKKLRSLSDYGVPDEVLVELATDFSAALDELKSEVKYLEDDVDDLERDKIKLEDEVEDLESEIDGLDSYSNYEIPGHLNNIVMSAAIESLFDNLDHIPAQAIEELVAKFQPK